MSRQGTPNLNHKKTPGQMVTDPLGQMGSVGGSSPAGHTVLNASRCVSDSTVANPKQLLNAYIYEFLVKNTLAETAKSFVAEADIPSVAYDSSHGSTKTSPMLVNHDGDKESSGSANTTPQTPAMTVAQFSEEHNIPNLALSMEAPQSFLYEWWQIFWDVFQAKNDRYASPLASQYHQIQVMRQKQQQDLQGMYMPQMHPQQGPMVMGGPNPPVNQAGMQMQIPEGGPQGNMPMQSMQRQQGSMDPRQQRYMMQMMMKQQQMPQNMQHPQQGQTPSGQPIAPQQSLPQQQQRTPQPTPQATPQMPSQRPQHLDQAPNNMSLNMNIQQPLFMQHQGNPSAQNRIQQQAQTQMNNLRQQAAVASQHQQPGQAHVQHPPQGPNQMGGSGVMVGPGAGNDMNDANSPGMNGPRMNQARPDRQGPPQNMASMPYAGQQHQHIMPNGPAMSPNYIQQPPGNSMAAQHMNQNTNQGRNSNALQDYQMQLMLLEKQNKKRLDIARSNGSDAGLPMQPMPPVSGASQRRSSSSSSPMSKNKSPPGGANGKLKKEAAAKKPRKPSGTNVPQSAGSESNGFANGKGMAQVKKEAATPSSPSNGDASKKRKAPGGDSPKKAAKPAVAGKDKTTPGLKRADDPHVMPNEDAHKDNTGMNPYFNHGNGEDKMMSVDLIDNNGSGDAFFGQAGNSNIDDMDFDFNSFLDGADGGLGGSLGEGLSNFNWGNPIEGD